MWAGHCGDDWHLTGPLWRILPVYQELFLIGCLKSNFLLHVPVCSLAAWMSGWLAAAYTHMATNTYTQRRAMFLHLYNWAETIVSVTNWEAIFCLSIIFHEKNGFPSRFAHVPVQDFCSLLFFLFHQSVFFYIHIANYWINVCMSHSQQAKQIPLPVEQFSPFCCPVFLPKRINADCRGPQIGCFQGRFVCNFTLKMLVIHLPCPVAHVWNDFFKALYFYLFLCSKTISKMQMGWKTDGNAKFLIGHWIYQSIPHQQQQKTKLMAQHLWMFSGNLVQSELQSHWLNYVLSCDKDFQIIKYLNGSRKGH